jgi:DNA-directed RNA polymerase subunit RPC12/RpoP
MSMPLRYRPIRMRDISSWSWYINPVVGLVMTGFDLVQRMNKEMNKEEAFYCSAPAQWRYGLCFKNVTVEDSVKDEDIPYMCERCGQYFDWLGILTKLVKKCPECGREIGIQDPINFCNQHGDKRVPMRIREVRM